ncbi:cupin domain-containing protein [Hymenobacter endophyticus]|uniref:Cupin domain-containing protein n=1 Tax=Hymenobacter endophyticus TaxID=3076335 RepID=A0ABU3TKF7_9BACT|nr:cupin domain-containing protein [Hymenobacter endophyticus]MDU0371859.1 cupin domain-containing protein [Hymenobacter endophyticus]
MTRFALGLSALLGLLALPGHAQTGTPMATAGSPGPIFLQGERAPAQHFTGTVWVKSLVNSDSTFQCVVGNVVFEPGARTHWHRHPTGQILLVTDGMGFYQEKGQPKRLVRKGDVIQALPGVEHWHGASAHQPMTHVAIVPNTEKGGAIWLQPVTAQQYQSEN